MRLFHAPAWDATVELYNTRRVGVDRGRRGTGISSTLKTSRYWQEYPTYVHCTDFGPVFVTAMFSATTNTYV